MKIDSPRFGSLDVETNKVIEFPAGLPGFESCKQFTLIEIEGRQDRLAALQSVDHPDVAFGVTTPDVLGLQYAFTLTEDEEQQLQASDPADIVVMLIVRPEDKSAAPGAARAIVTAPLIFNVATMRGIQKVIGRAGCDVTLQRQGR